MATLTPKLTLTSNDISSSEQLNLTLTNTLTVDGPVQTKRLAIDSTATELHTNAVVLANGSYTKSFVLLYNTSTAASGEIITIGTVDASGGTDAALTTVNVSLAPGEWAFYPWNSSVDLMAEASSGSPVLEVRIFQNLA
jgi:hypothetical protein